MESPTDNDNRNRTSEMVAVTPNSGVYSGATWCVLRRNVVLRWRNVVLRWRNVVLRWRNVHVHSCATQSFSFSFSF